MRWSRLGGIVSPVATFFSTTVAPGTLPSLSFTTPFSVALVVPPCPNTGAATRANASARTDIHPDLAILFLLLDDHRPPEGMKNRAGETAWLESRPES